MGEAGLEPAKAKPADLQSNLTPKINPLKTDNNSRDPQKVPAAHGFFFDVSGFFRHHSELPGTDDTDKTTDAGNPHGYQDRRRYRQIGANSSH